MCEDEYCILERERERDKPFSPSVTYGYFAAHAIRCPMPCALEWRLDCLLQYVPEDYSHAYV